MFETTEDQTGPSIQQLSIFLENRLGALLGITRILETHQINICALSIMDAADYAVVRMVVDKPTLASATLMAEGYHLLVTDMVGVALPAARPGGMRRVLQALISAEIDVNYVYAVACTRAAPRAVLALHVKEIERAHAVLKERGIELIGQDELL